MLIRVHCFGEKAISQDENNSDAYYLKCTIFVSFYFFSIFSDWMRQFALRKFLRLSQFKIIVTPLNSGARVGSNFRRINLTPGSLTDHDLTFCFQNWVVTNWDSFPFDCIFLFPWSKSASVKRNQIKLPQQTTMKYTSYVFNPIWICIITYCKINLCISEQELSDIGRFVLSNFL